MNQQKTVFLKKEGNEWFRRNRKKIGETNFETDDPVVPLVASVLKVGSAKTLLEIGCGEATRLVYLKKLGLQCRGIDPSIKAVCAARKKGLSVVRGTADSLPYRKNLFDIVVFGFCLYVCDREDLFRIAQEADRVLKKSGWLIIHDFFAPNFIRAKYKHYPELFTYKMDYRRLFEWHPSYTCFSHEVRHQETSEFTDEAGEWVATSVLRKKTAS